ncbi:hypothetical protein GOFOIKOB_2865 [Methylobacterium tardum]|uniref:Uncharacterized protein n=1 Tax=Methylobacterium tardum TaxID=374432 RepID=A0AA37WW80_9HYPH|nr:hypothetical protein [Methylobacterium tardum]GJE49825.1 hypothetical protein GOFOIKOB_2865 [Methylobacterium tardum]GLS73153.1 hypothetical protein GCM10007890_51680 [Methylobacterium tardum]
MIALSGTGRDRVRPPPNCGGGPILDLALCLILSVTVVGLLLLAL